jgi:hypothetical protein
MADGSTTQTFNKIIDDLEQLTGYESVVIENGKRITSKYDLNFEVTSTETVVVFSDLKEIEDMTSEFQSAWDTIDGNALYNITELKFAVRDDGTILVVSEGSDEIFGRINNWTGENTWTDWNGREVTNTNYSYNFHDGNWNSFGSSGGYSRELAFEVGDKRWDGETATEAEKISDESGTHVNYRLDAPELDADSTSWDLLAPEVGLLARIKYEDEALAWSDITQISIGSNSWSQLDTNGATRDEAFTSSDRSVELYVQHEGGGQVYVGRIEYRSDGLVEIYNNNWERVARTVDLKSDNLLEWSDLTVSTSPDYVEGLKAAWNEVGKYLPSAMLDDSTTDADEREGLVFTQNQWGDLNVFSDTGDFLARIDSWEHDHYWKTVMWDEETRTYSEGYKYNTGPGFEFRDDEFNTLARTSSEKKYFLSDDVIDASYGGTPPSSFAEIESMDHVVLSGESGNSGFNVNKSDFTGDLITSVWNGDLKDDYDIPDAAASVDGIWVWEDVTSLFISTDYWKEYDANGEETNGSENERVEYLAEGFWFDSEFVLLSNHSESVHGSLNQLHPYEGRLGVIEYRDGFIEVRDSNWNTLGRFVDIKNAVGFNSFADDYEGLEAAWDAVTTYLPSDWGERANLLFTADNSDNILVMDTSGILLGRINNWGYENTWTDWNGREVTNTNYSYNFHDGDWNYFGSSGGYSRELAFEVGDKRWDGETATEAEKISDESGTHVNYRVDAPELDADSTSWDLLAPEVGLLARIKYDDEALAWSDITQISIGSNSWSQLDTNGATRDEAFTSSDRSVELHVQHEGGGQVYVGRIEYRSDGLVEIYNNNWERVARTVDLKSDNLLEWSELTVSTSPDYVEGLKAAWNEVGKYLPSAMLDDSTTDADEREGLVFTQNQWGDLNVFSDTGDFLARIDSWEHDHYWKTDYWNEETRTYSEGYKYNTGPGFEFRDDEFNTLARTSSEKKYFLSDDVIDASYGGTPPSSFAEIESMDHVVLSGESGNSGFNVNKSDFTGDLITSVWNGDLKDDYDIPDAAASVDGIWVWEDVTSLFISTDYWKEYDANGEETNGSENERVEYLAEGFWFDSEFVLLSNHSESVHGSLNQLHPHEGRLGVIEYRDGFVEVRDSNWNIIESFADLANAQGLANFIKDTVFEDFENAWNAVEAYLPSEWGALLDLKFTADNSDNILVMNSSGILLARVNVWLDTTISDDGSTIHEGSYFGFQDADYKHLAGYNSYEREENNLIRYSDVDVSTIVYLDELSNDDIAKFSPIENNSGITINSIDYVWTYESTETNYDSSGDATSDSSETRMEYFSSDGQFIAAQEDIGGITYLFDNEGQIVGTSMSGELVSPNFLDVGTYLNTPGILQKWLDMYEDDLETFSGESGDWSFMQTEAGGIVLLVNDNIVAVGNPEIEERSDEVEWRIKFKELEAEIFGQNSMTDNVGELSLSKSRVDLQVQLYAGDDEELGIFEEFIDTYSPPSNVDLTGTPAEGFDFSKLESINYRTKNKDYDGTGEYKNSSELSFIPYNQWGGSDWENKLSVEYKNGMFSIKDSNWDDIGVSWFDPDIELSTPDFLGSNTEVILDNWFEVHESNLEQILGLDESVVWEIAQTRTGAISLSADGKMLSLGETRVREPEDNGETYWDIEFDSVYSHQIRIEGWNGVTDTDGEYDTIKNGVKLSIEYLPDDQEFDLIVDKYAPGEEVAIENTSAKSFDFESISKISYGIWNNDSDGVGAYSVRTEAQFVPKDDFGNEDWDNSLTSHLENGVITLRGSEWNDVIIAWLDITSSNPNVTYSDFEKHAGVLSSLLGSNNQFEFADYTLINNSLLAIDVDRNGSTDMYITGAANDENWQELLDPNTLQQIGGIYKGSGSNFARLPSKFDNVKDWVEYFQERLESIDSDDADTISIHLGDMMQRNLDVQIAFYKTTTESDWDHSVGLEFRDGRSSEGQFSLDKATDGTYQVWMKVPGIDENSDPIEISVPISVELFIDGSDLPLYLDLSQSDLSFDIDININSAVAFTDFDNDSEIVNDTMEKMFAGEFSYVIEDLYELGMNATHAEDDNGNTLIKIASSGDIDHFLVFEGDMEIEDVNNAIDDPKNNGETFAKLTGLESIKVATDFTLATFEINEGTLTITNFDTRETDNASIVMEASDLFAVDFGDLYTSVISMLHELNPNNKYGDSKSYNELAENAVIDYGLNAFKLYSGDDIVFSTTMDKQETADASTIMQFDDSKVVLDSPYTNISDIMTSLIDTDFEPILAAEITATSNNSSNKAGIQVSNADNDLLVVITNDMDQYNSFDLDTLLTEENLIENSDGFTFQNSNENYVVDIIANTDLPFDDVLEILQSDIL